LAAEPTPVNAKLTLSGVSGSVLCTTDAPVTVSVDDIVRAGGGYGVVTAVNSTTEFVVNFLQPVKDFWADDPTQRPFPQAAGTWSISTPFDTVAGLEHLEGMQVKVLADGNVLPDKTVTNGKIQLDFAATKVVVGLGYKAQLQTLQLDVGDPSIQGKRKKISAATVKVVDSRGLRIGNTFETLVDYKQVGPTVYGLPQPLLTTNIRTVLDPLWAQEGQVCIEQSYPLPLTVLSLALEVTVGDA
jgi:hypothetical protein